MFSEYQTFIDESHKTSYIQCVVDTATELNRITSNINSDMQLVINYAENELKEFKDAKNTAEKILTVFLSSEENIITARHNFLNAYHVWLKECQKIQYQIKKNYISKNNVKNESLPHFKDIKNKYVIEVEDSDESDIEIVNEIKYLKPQNTVSDSNEDDEITSKSSGIESNITVFSRNKKKEINSDSASENLNDATNSKGTFDLQQLSDFILSETEIENTKLKRNSILDSDSTNFSQAVSEGSSLIQETSCNTFPSDKKLSAKCIVVLEHLSHNILKKYNKSSLLQCRKLMNNNEFLRLIDLHALEKPRNKRCYISSNESNMSGNSSSSSSLHNNKVKNKKFKAYSSEDEVSSFYGSSDDISEKNINNNEYLTFHKYSDIEKLTEQTEERLKQQLLKSDESTEEADDIIDNEQESPEKNKKEKKKRKDIKEANINSIGSEDEIREESWMKDDILNFRLHSTEKNRARRTAKKIIIITEDSDSASDQVELTRRKKKKRKKLNVLRSDSEIDSVRSSSDSDCQIVKGNSQLSTTFQVSGNHNSEEQAVNVALSPSKPGRRNIRKLFDDEEVTEATKRAGKTEENRLQRLAERKEQLQVLQTEKNKEENVLILDFDVEKKIELLKVDKGLVKFLKPHQANGIKFMWESCFESLEQVRSSEGSGCILAHCMGLGKTFQIVTLVHTLLVNKNTTINTVMVLCPMNTILNWVEEFDMWLRHAEKKANIRVYDLTQIKKMSRRIAQLKFWHELGGVLVVSYDMFRYFMSDEKKLNHLQIQKIKTYLLNPGADLVVCDEGHLLKNESSKLARIIQSVKTKRRVILTGTPLQNNLSEYHCMVQFVKPNLLGSNVEFQNRFGNPITNGQFDNSTPKDVKLMKHRAHVLHRMLEGCVQRCDYAVLTPFLPPKHEYVILLRLSELQIEMYRHFIDSIARKNAKNCNLFKNYHEITKLTAHPNTMLLREQSKKSNRKNIDENGVNIANTPNNFNPDEKENWWYKFIKDEIALDLTKSYKLILLFGILERCEKEGDKILVFSQSLQTLNLIEIFLKEFDSQAKKNSSYCDLFSFQGEWKRGLDYFRLDGSVNCEKRNSACKTFNNCNNKRARLLLISTKAGGLGINLIGANRVVIFDPSWNPSNDVQSIFRIFRFGQNKPCYIYRFLSAGTIEQKIYNRQVTKLSLSLRVLDEQQIERHYRDTELAELYKFEPVTDVPILNLPKDHVLADVFLKFKNYVYKFFEHDSLLENKEEEELDEAERMQAWSEYQQEKLTEQIKTNQRKRVPDKTAEDSALEKQPPVLTDAANTIAEQTCSNEYNLQNISNLF